MTDTQHAERHFLSSESLRDIVIGMADGLTVPFALAAGISGAIQSTGVVVAAGLAEVAAGSISMGLGGYLAARGDAERYVSELARERREVIERPEDEHRECEEVLETYGLAPEHAKQVVDALAANPEKWVDFMMRFELGLEEPHPNRALASAVTIAGAYVVGGMVPLFPYFLLPRVGQALQLSIAVTLVALATFGFAKSKATGANPIKGAAQTVLVGGIAAAAAFGLARLVAG